MNLKNGFAIFEALREDGFLPRLVGVALRDVLLSVTALPKLEVSSYKINKINLLSMGKEKFYTYIFIQKIRV